MKIKYWIIAFVTAIFMLEPISGFAYETYIMPEIETAEKSLTIHFYVQKNGVEYPIEGAKIALYKVASLETENGSANYTVLSKYNAVQVVENEKDVTFDGISGTEAENLAKDLSDLVSEYDAVGETDENGNCTFERLEQGMYLFKEIERSGEALKYEAFAPCLISVPYPIQSESGNYWVYQVVSEPKTMVAEVVIENSDSEYDESGCSDNDTSRKISEKDNSTVNDFNDKTVNTGALSKSILFLMALFGTVLLIIVIKEKAKGE